MDFLLNQRLFRQRFLKDSLPLWFFLGILVLVVGLSPSQASASETEGQYQNDLVIRIDRLEQQEQKNQSQASRLSGLFDPAADKKLRQEQEEALEEREYFVDQLFQEELPALKSLDKEALFATTETKIVYHSAEESQEEGGFSGIFYGILGLVILGSFVYICYLFLKG